jgi:ATP-dependent DNA ligase
VPLPLKPPLAPQLARSRSELPVGDDWCYEPKYDGFRAIVFVDGGQRTIQSRGGKTLDRYFPELAFPEGRYVLDGEIIVGTPEQHDFERLQQRIHPAESRVRMLAEQMPASYVAFDLLARENDELLDTPFRERRATLARDIAAPVILTPSESKPQDAEHWLRDAEGVIAKQLDAPYRPGERMGMVKVKRVRTIDCVVVGWRPGKEEGTLGSLILGLYDADGELREVGHTSGFKAREKRELPAKLAPYETGERGSGEPSRWTQGRELEWISVRPELVVEVSFDHASAGRIRHGARLLRWRDDKPPAACTFDQLES